MFLPQEQLFQLAAHLERADERLEHIRDYFLEEYRFLEQERLKVFPEIAQALNKVAMPQKGQAWF